MQEVVGSIPTSSTRFHSRLTSAGPRASVVDTTSPSSRGLGHRPFTAVTGVRIPVGTPLIKEPAKGRFFYELCFHVAMRTPRFDEPAAAGSDARSAPRRGEQTHKRLRINPRGDATHKRTGKGRFFYELCFHVATRPPRFDEPAAAGSDARSAPRRGEQTRERMRINPLGDGALGCIAGRQPSLKALSFDSPTALSSPLATRLARHVY